MRSRWFHKPEIHKSHSGTKRAAWLELFYDVIFAASFVQLGTGLAEDPTFKSVLTFIIVFASLWFTWLGYTIFSNRFNVDDFLHRIMVFAQIVAIAGMSIFAPQIIREQPMTFCLFYSASQLIVALLYFRSYKQTNENQEFSRYWGLVFFSGAVIWFTSAFLPEPWAYALWILSIVAYLIAPLTSKSKSMTERWPLDVAHFSERVGLLTLIVMGESFIKIMANLTHASSDGRIFAQAVFILLLMFTLWWIYFDDIAGSVIRRTKYSINLWLFGHLPLQGAIVALGLGVQNATNLALDQPAPFTDRWLLCISLATVFASVALIDAATDRKQAELADGVRVKMRLASSVLLLLLAPASRGMTSATLLALISVIAAAQVLFDMFMAPFDFGISLISRDISEIARERALANQPAPKIRLGDAVRKGTPSELRNDLYSFFLDGSWSKFFAVFVAVYLLGNVFFAGIYMIDPDSIGGSRLNSFADAFYFSAQTMATIGYGVLHPKNDFSNMVVVIEAAVSLAGTALVTGLMVAKSSRPTAKLVFSKPILITKMDGKLTLLFRVGNTRGKDIASAEMTLSLLTDWVSPEGQHMRRMNDLKLVRRRSPFFNLSWLVMHEIDDESPLKALIRDDNTLDSRALGFVSVLTGHESTYGQTVYARHIYPIENVVFNQYFVDVMSELPDGRLMIDYAKFHDIKA
jgi:inward rectifier potassium channel